MLRLLIDIYENNAPDPVLGHVLYGQTEDEIKGVMAAHKGTDSFFRAALDGKPFRGMILRTRWTWL